MSATFGKLQGRTLELQEGLNIIQAPNETGKSTWCAFLLSMFYGINSRERDKAGFIADKNRYAPWSGTAMSGRLDCRVDGKEITLTRTTKRQTAPMGNFEAVYTGTGNTVPSLSSATCGEELLGVTREVYERSAFIRQSGLAISQDAGLERRIASLITSGEEDTSYSEAADALKKQLNRRRHNKTGQLPVLETELADIRRQLEDTEQMANQLSAARKQIEELEAQQKALSAQLALHDQWEAAKQQQALQEAEAATEQAEQRFRLLRQRIEEENIPGNETIGRLRGAIVNLETTRKAVERARTERDEAAKALLRAETAVSESPFAGQSAESARKESEEPPQIRPNLLFPILISMILFAVLAGAMYALHQPLGIYAAALIAIVLQLILANRARKVARTAALTKRFGTSDPTEISTLANQYAQLLAARDAAQAELDKRITAADTLYNTLSSNEQAILLEIRRFAPAAYDLSTADGLLRSCAVRRKELAEAEGAARESHMRRDLLAQQISCDTATPLPTEPPARSRTIVETQLEATKANLSVVRSAADRLTGQLHALGDPLELRSAEARLTEQIAALESEYQAIRMAMETLETANTTLQNRFSPALGQRAAEIFRELTDSRYTGVVLDRSFHLAAEPTGDSIYRDAALLSAGAADQLYLATRLAICDLVLPAEKAVPIVLDDALTNFDDERCVAALKWLKEAAKQRQIILFTCHSREADFFAGDGEVSVQRLTEAV